MGRICIEDLKGAKHHSLYCNCVVVLYISGTSNGYINIICNLKKKKKKDTKIPYLCGRKKETLTTEKSLILICCCLFYGN